MDDYPRPDFLRVESNWQSLNGAWDFLFDDHDVGLNNAWQLNALSSGGKSKRQIEVPFVFQSQASGINERGKLLNLFTSPPLPQSNYPISSHALNGLEAPTQSGTLLHLSSNY